MKGKSFFFVVFLLVLTFTQASAEVVDLGKGFDSVSVIVERSDDMSTVVSFELGSFEKTPVKTDKGTYYKITSNYEEILTKPCEPELPQLVRDIVIPDGKEAEIKVLSSEYRDFEGMPVIPSKGLLPRSDDLDTIKYTFGPVYESDSWYPSKLVELSDPFILRDIRGVTIKLNAFQYNPKKQVLRVYAKVKLEVKTLGSGKLNILKENYKHNPVKAFEDIYRSQFINYSFNQPKGGLAQEAGDMLIITADAFHDSTMPFVNWKRQKGFKTTIVGVPSAISNDTASIRAFVQSYYDTTNLAWLLLVGDVNFVPTPFDTASGWSDG